MKLSYLIAAAVLAAVIAGIWTIPHILPSPFGLPKAVIEHEVKKEIEEALPQVPELPLPQVTEGLEAPKPSLIERIWPKKAPKAKPRRKTHARAPEYVQPQPVRYCFWFHVRCVMVDPVTSLVIEEPAYLPVPIE